MVQPETILEPALGRRSDEPVRALSRGAGISFVLLSVGTLLGLGLQLLIARVLGVQEFARYTYAAAWLGTLAIVSRLGYDTALVRFVPAHRARSEWRSLDHLLRDSNRVAAYASLAITVVGLTAAWLLRARIGAALALTLAIGFATVPLLTRIGLRQSALRALKCMPGASCPEAIFKQLALAGIVLLAACVGARYTTAPWIMAGNMVSTGAALWLANYWLKRVLGRDSTSRLATSVDDGPRRRQWAGVALFLFMMSLVNLVLNQADVMLLGILADVRQAGLYAIASRLAGIAGFGLLAVNTMIAPMITELHATGRRQSLQQVVTRGARVALLAMLLGGGFLAASGHWVLGWFGGEFREAHGALLVLLAGQAANTLGGSVGFLMTMTGLERRALAVVGSGAVLNIVLHVALIPRFGMLGAAISTAVATLAWNVVLVADAWRQLRIDPTSWGRFTKNSSSFGGEGLALVAQGDPPCPDQTF